MVGLMLSMECLSKFTKKAEYEGGDSQRKAEDNLYVHKYYLMKGTNI